VSGRVYCVVSLKPGPSSIGHGVFEERGKT